MIDKFITPQSQASLRQLCGWAWRALRGSRGRVGLVCVLGILRVAASLGFVWVSKMLIDTATTASTPASTLWWLSALLASLMLAEMALSQVNIYVRSVTTQRLTNDLRSRIYAALLLADNYTDHHHTGDYLNRIIVDVNSVADTLVKTLPNIVAMVVQLAAAFWLLCVMSPLLALCALVITPICILASKAYVMKMRSINAEIRRGESLIHTSLQEGLQHRVVVQTLECAPEISSRLEQLQQAVLGHVLVRTRVNLYSRAMVNFGFIAGYLIAFIWSVFGIHSGAITYGIMTAFLQLVGRIQGPISSLSTSIPGLVNTTTAIDRLMEVYPAGDTHRTPAAAAADALPAGAPVGILISDVTFAYPGTDRLIFNGFSHDFAPGSKTVIMGETGVGKSTLTKMILALLHPQSGTVEAYAGGQAVGVSARTRQYMTYVPQGNSLLHGTIRENLLLGNPQATEEQLRRVLDIAVANFVFDLPEGLDSPCGELGTSLSEGQCQRIAIARALLRDCPVLILDEFNSSLDPSTAASLLQRLIASHPAATIIFISHRPEVAEYSDSVLKLN